MPFRFSPHEALFILGRLMGLDLDVLMGDLLSGGLISAGACKLICHHLTELLAQESNLIELSSPITVVGDIHGQFWDLLELLKVGGSPPHTCYLFMGDFVDRGYFSLQTIALLSCFKLRFPQRVALIRGNHESRNCTKVYGFYEECRTRFGEQGMEVWHAFTAMFDYIPISALIDGKIFCTHGGLSPSLQTIDQIKVLTRFQEIPFEGLLTDLMWSDPESDATGFTISKRGVGYVFGEDVVDRFLEVNGVDYILRAHQLCLDGYQVLFHDRFATVWSAPNYCYRARNKAVILEIGENQSKNFKFFKPSEENERRVEKNTGPARMKAMDYFN